MTDTSHSHVLAAQAKRAYEAGDYLTAESDFALAAGSFASEGDAVMAAEMMNNRGVSLLRVKQPQAALAAVEGTEAVFEAAGDHKRMGMALANQATALEALKRFPDAIERYQRAGAALEKAGEEQLRAQVFQLLSALHLRRWRFVEAVIALQAGLAGVKNPTPRQRLIKRLLFFRP